MTARTPDGPRRRGRAAKYWVLGGAAFLLSFVVVWLPQINGPHLWLGVPSILWWTCVPGSLLITPMLWLFDRWQERDNPGLDDEDDDGADVEVNGR